MKLHSCRVAEKYMKLLNLTITKVDEPVFDAEVVSVTVPGSDGEMTLLANHAPIISPLKAGVLVIKREDNSEETINIASGTLEMSDNHATVLI